MMEKNIEQSIIDSVKSEKLADLVVEGAEFTTDLLLDNGVVKDIPIFGTLVKVYQAASHIREGLFARKIYKFLSEIRFLSTAERAKVIEEIGNKKGGMQAAGATLISLIEKIDDEEKPELVGKLFIACAKGRISVEALLKLANIVSTVYIDDIKNLSFVEGGYDFSKQQQNSYVASGLMVSSIKKPVNFAEEGYSLADVAKAIYEHGLELEYEFTNDAKLIAEICLEVKLSKPVDLSTFFDL